MPDHDPSADHEPYPRQHGPWLIHRSHQPYHDPWVQVRRDEVTRPDGLPGSYAVVYLKPGVCVLALDTDNHVVLTKEFHYGVGRTTTEAVSGGIESGDSPEQTAHRELAEELGITAGKLTKLGMTDPFTANVVSPTHLFLAEQLSNGDANPEGTEQIEPVRVPFSQAIAWVLEGQITHAPSCLVILRAAIKKNQALP